MPIRIKVVCNAASNGAMNVVRKLRESGVKALKVRAINPRVNRAFTVGWGTSVEGVRLNKLSAVNIAKDKLSTFTRLAASGVTEIPVYYQTAAEVSRVRAEGDIWLARTRGGTAGEGITVVRWGDPLPPNAQLYVKYIPKAREFRTHVFRQSDGVKLIHLQEKKRRKGAEREGDSKLIRSHNNGWVFCENNLDVSAELRAQLEAVSVRALNALGLDFAALDVVVPKNGGNLVVLEANTRPGIESTATTAAYAGAILNAARG